MMKKLICVLALGAAVPAAASDWCRDNDTEIRELEPLVFTAGDSKVTYHVMDRNLGAVSREQNLVANLGHLYQWGREADGHQLRNSAQIAGGNTLTYENFVANYATYMGKFINNTGNVAYWASGNTTTSDNLWNGLEGTYNPCPEGWRVPASDEWTVLLNIPSPNGGAYLSGNVIGFSDVYGTLNDNIEARYKDESGTVVIWPYITLEGKAHGALQTNGYYKAAALPAQENQTAYLRVAYPAPNDATILELPAGGTRGAADGVINYDRNLGYYWSSTVSTSAGSAKRIQFHHNQGIYLEQNAWTSAGQSVRCIYTQISPIMSYLIPDGEANIAIRYENGNIRVTGVSDQATVTVTNLQGQTMVAPVPASRSIPFSQQGFVIVVVNDNGNEFARKLVIE
jgi:hypothetical protein